MKRSERFPLVVSAAVLAWLSIFGLLWYTDGSSAPLAFTSDAVSHAAVPLFFFGFPLLIVVASVWYEWPLLSAAARTIRLLLTGVLAVSMMLAIALVGLLGLPYHHPRQSLNVGSYRVTLTALSCGATCRGGLELNQEWPVMPGVVRRRRPVPYWASRADDGVISVVRRSPSVDSLRVTARVYRNDRYVLVDTTLALSPRP